MTSPITSPLAVRAANRLTAAAVELRRAMTDGTDGDAVHERFADAVDDYVEHRTPIDRARDEILVAHPNPDLDAAEYAATAAVAAEGLRQDVSTLLDGLARRARANRPEAGGARTPQEGP